MTEQYYVFLDTETRSGKDLKKSGVDLCYHLDPDFALLVVCYIIAKEEDGKFFLVTHELIDMTKDDADLSELRDYLDAGATFVAHNAMFDIRALKYGAGINIDPRNVIDTADLARAYALPQSLKDVGAYFNLQQQKSNTGESLINVFSKPHKKTGVFVSPEDAPALWEEFKEYCSQDVLTLYHLFQAFPKQLNNTDTEKDFRRITLELNFRGIPFDRELVDCVQEQLPLAQKQLEKDAENLTGVEGILSSGKKLKDWAWDACHYMLDNAQKEYLDTVAEEKDLPPELRRLLELRSQYNYSATKKYKSIQMNITDQDRLENCFVYCGASRTGRDSGRMLQPQNLKRLVLSNEEIDLKIRFIKVGMYDLIGDYTGAIESFAQIIRPTVKATAGKVLVGADFSAIESRVLAWIVGEEWKLKFYQDYDAGRMEYDIYRAVYGGAFGINPVEVTKAQRQIGKVMELALGYGGGANAFGRMAENYGIDLEALALDIMNTYEFDPLMTNSLSYAYKIGADNVFAACDFLKRQWRATSKITEQSWGITERAFIKATGYSQQGKPYSEALFNDKIIIANSDYLTSVGVDIGGLRRFVGIRLPSKRWLIYDRPAVKQNSLFFMGIDNRSGRYVEQNTYGGRLIENITQAVSRDLMAESAIRVDNAGYSIILRVHDELVCEEPIGVDVDGLVNLMTITPQWAKGVPIAAEGWVDERYVK